MGMLGVGLAQHVGELGQQGVQKPDLPHQEERGQGVAALQGLGELLGDPGRRRFDDLLAVVEDRLVSVRRDREAEAARELDRPEHADRVLAKADVWIADRSDEPGFEVLQSADVVDHREVRDVVEEAVDREVAPQGVLARRAEGVVRRHQELRRVGVGRLGPAAERRDLDHLAVGEQDVGQAESPPDQAAVAEEAAQRRRVRVGSDVEVLRRALQEQIPDASPHEVRLVAGARETGEHLQGVRVDLSPGDRVLAARADARRRLRRCLDSRIRGV